MRSTSLVMLALVVSACTGARTDTTVAATVAATTSTAPVPTSTLPPVVECPGVGEFREGGGIEDIPGEDSDSTTIGSISWETSDQCETFRFDFESSEGAPATSVPSIRIDHLDSFQVVRIHMDIDATVITDQLVETDLVDRLYVVRSLSRGMFVDLHLASPASVRAETTSSPARLSLELRPGFVPFTGESILGENIVLTSPVASAQVGSLVQFLGYSRTFEANVLAVVTQGDDVVSETNTTAADSLETWGEFRLQLDLPPGEVSVFVGQENPDDGSLEGISVDLTVS